MGERWARTKELFTQALEHEPADREAFLIEACEADDALRIEVESLLRSHDRGDSLLDTPAAPWHQVLAVNMTGRLVGDYRVLREAGRGGSSIVYLAQRADQQFQKRVAIKMLRCVDESADVLQRFRNERQTLAELNHPNIVTLLDGGTTEEGMPYLVMDFVEGVPIDKYCDSQLLRIRDRLQIFRTVCDSVGYAHRNGVIHRDLKPSNILVTKEGVPQLLDFGIAKLHDPGRFSLTTMVTLIGTRALTPEYASPEQLRGQPVTGATDIYSLGVLLYVLLCGRHPYRTTGRSLLDWEHAVCDVEPQRPSLAAARDEKMADPDELPQPASSQHLAALRADRPAGLRRTLRGDLDAITMKALAKEPERRYRSAREFSDDLGRFLLGMPVTARRTNFAYRSMKFVARHRESLVVAAIAAAAAVIVGAWEVQRVRAVRADRASLSAPGPWRPAVAVLGFQNLSGREDTAWVATALSEMLTTELASSGKIRLLPGESVARARIDLALPEVATLSASTLKAVRQRLGSDFIVSGSYLDLGAAAGGRVRLDLRLQDAVRGETLASASVEGAEPQLLDLVSRSGARLRAGLGMPGMLPAESTFLQSALPSNSDAARWYSEGLAKLRSFDALGARDLLSRAVTADPGYSLAHSALAQAWLALGYDSKGREEAKAALDNARGLNRENQLLVEGGYYEAERDWPKAIDTYRTLFNFFPDSPEYGLALVHAQTLAGQGKEGMLTLQKLRSLPREADLDPRLDLATVNAASLLTDNALQAKAADSAVRKGRLTGAKLLVAEARVQQCRALANMGDFTRSNAACEESRAIYEAAGDGRGTATVLHTMAEVPMDRGDFDRAEDLYGKALAIVRRIGDARGIARELGNLGTIYLTQGYWAKAAQFHRDFLAASKEIGERHFVGTALDALGEISRSQGQLRESQVQFQDSISMARETGNAELEAIDLVDLGDLALDQGDLGAAARQFDQAMKIFHDIGEKGYQAQVLVESGRVKAIQGDTAAARVLYTQALAMQKLLDVKGDLAETQLRLGELLCETDEASDGTSLLRSALPEFQAEKRASDEIRARAILARALLLQDQVAAARAAIDSAAPLIDRGSIQDRLEWQLEDARVRAAEKNASGAKRAGEQALDDAKSHGLVGTQFEASLVLGEIQLSGPSPALARAELARLQKRAKRYGFELIARKAAALMAPTGSR